MTDILWSTGFEHGTYQVVPASNITGSWTTSSGKNGNYAAMANSYASSGNTITVDGFNTSEIVFSAWIYKTDSSVNKINIYAILTGGGKLEIRENGGLPMRFDAYVDGTKVASGSITIQINKWHYIQVRFVVDQTNGVIETKINGETDIQYAGDTEIDSGDVVESIKINLARTGYKIDDISITDEWPEAEIRHAVLYPTSDVSVQWTPSSGSLNFQMVEDIPPDDGSTYIYATSGSLVDRFNMSQWVGTDKEPKALIVWVRAKRDVATPLSGYKLSITTGSLVETSGCFTPSLAWDENKPWVLNRTPSGSQWTESLINNTDISIESVI